MPPFGPDLITQGRQAILRPTYTGISETLKIPSVCLPAGGSLVSSLACEEVLPLS